MLERVKLVMMQQYIGGVHESRISKMILQSLNAIQQQLFWGEQKPKGETTGPLDVDLLRCKSGNAAQDLQKDVLDWFYSGFPCRTKGLVQCP